MTAHGKSTHCSSWRRGIEALEAAIEYKNKYIQNRQKVLIDSSRILTQSEANIIKKFSSLSPSETRSILVRYFNKAITLQPKN
ncbi:hypothetical protein XENTR_v10013915 [Xenopus tropicalis]|nr:hypothetical protein XENTR_v10013915 [Xenopus tropicalis]|eukprot:XP_012819155.1 PREDICTED: kinesin-like protein KIF27 isoform X3 [Xenopus tropicalis]